VGDNGKILKSSNGTSWSTLTSGTTKRLVGIGNSGSTRLVAMAEDSTAIISDDHGATWRSQPINAPFPITYATATLARGVGGFQMTSSNGTNWNYSLPNFSGVSALAQGNGRTIALGANYAVSTDLDNWSGVAMRYSHQAITFGKGLFVSAGTGDNATGYGNIATSVDGSKWISRSTPILSKFNAAAYGAGKFVAVGQIGKIVSSSDTVTWTDRTISGSQDLHAVTYGGGRFVGVGASSVRYSTDGDTWSSTSISGTMRGISYGKGLFVAVGDSGAIRTSTDGTSWTSRTSNTGQGLKSISFTGSLFIAVGDQDGGGNGAVVVSSTDGITWTKETAFFANGLTASTAGSGYFVAGGASGTILAAPYQDTTSPAITSEPSPASQTVSAGANVSYTVAGTGTGVAYQWFKDGTPLTDGNGISGVTSATLTLTGVDVLDTGIYQVAIYNNSGSDLSQALTLNVNGPPIIITHPVSIITSNTYTTNFTVIAVGPGTLTYQWRKGGQPLSDGGHYSGTATDRLTITGATGADEATYDVIVSNTFGSSSPSNGATLTVNRPPTITTPPVALNIKETQTISLSVVVDGSPTLTYVWKRNGVTVNDGGRISGASTANLVITGATVADGGGYTVTVANSYSPAATSVSAYVNVLGPGAFNPDFTFNGTSTVWDIAPTADGKFIVGGDFGVTSGLSWTRLAKIDVNGALTANFATTNGANTANSTIRTVALQPDGQIVVGGSFWQWGGSTTYGYTVRLSADGVLDTTYLPATAMTVQTIIPVAGNKMLVARTLLGFATSYVTRYNADGTKDNTFTEVVNSNRQLNNMAVQSDGTIWMAGLFGLKKANADGTNPTSVTTYASFGEMGFVNVGPDDKIYYSDNNGIYFGRLNADGTRDTTFTVDSNINGHVIDMAFLPNGNMVIVGSFQTVQSTTSAYIAVLDNTGALVNGFSSPFTWVSGGSIRTIQMLDDGSALLGGSAQVTLPSVQKYLHRVQIYTADLYVTTHPLSQTVNRYEPVTFTALGEGTSTVSYQWRKNGENIPNATSSSYTINNATEANQGTYDVVVTNLSGSRTSRGAVLAVLGDVFISGQPVSLVVTQYLSATFSVTATGAIPITYQWRKNGQNIPNATSSSYTISSAKVGDAANYDVVVSNPLGNQPSALVALSVVGSGAAAGTPGTLDTSFTAATLNSSSIYGVNVDAQGRVYVTGGFTSYNSQTRDRFMRLNADLTLDSSFAPSFNNITFATRFLPDGGFLIGGQFNSLNSATKYGIARFNSADQLQTDPTLSNFGTVGDGNAANGITVNADGSYFILGSFTTVNTTSRPYIAKINADHTLNSTFAPSAYPYTQNSSMRSIAVAADGSVIATGKILSTFASGDTHVGIVRYLANGTVDTSYNTQIDSNSNGPLEIGYQSSGKAIIIGTFSTVKDNPAAGAQTRYGIARLNTDGTVDTSFNANLNTSGQVYDMIIQPDDKIIIVGNFSSVNSTSRGRIARLNADGTLDTTFATGTGANNLVHSIAPLPTGSYVISGQFTSFDGDSTKKYLTKIHGTPPTPPALSIIRHPMSQTILTGEPVDFSVAAVGKAPLTFKWKQGVNEIPDAVNPTYHINSVTAGNAGDYTVVVTDADGNVTSNVATLTVSEGATFAAWSADKGLTTGVNDGFNDDADGDGVKNVVEYVFNTHPNQGGSKPLIEKIKQNVSGTDYPAVRVIALKDLQDIDVVVQASTSATFSSIIPTITTVVDQGNGTQQITIRTTTPFSSTAQVFFRFIIRDQIVGP